MEIEKLAKLARISLNQTEKEKLQKEFEAILDYVSALKKADTGGLEGYFSKAKILNVMREDREDENVHKAGNFAKELLEKAPFTESGYVKVKHVFEQSYN